MQITRANTVRVQAAQKTTKAPVAAVKAVPRRELLASGATLAAVLLGAVGSAQAAGESSASRALTAVNRPTQLKKKDEARKALKEKAEAVRQGEVDPKSLP